jgi:hypothetical protein
VAIKPEFGGMEDLLPDGCIPVAGVRILQYMDNKGDLHFAYGVSGNVPLSSYIGIIELGKEHIRDHFLEEEEDDA